MLFFIPLHSSSDVAEPVGLRKSSSNSGLGFIPRAPTGSEWGRSAGGSRDTVGLQEILKDLDREAGYVCVYVCLSVTYICRRGQWEWFREEFGG